LRKRVLTLLLMLSASIILTSCGKTGAGQTAQLQHRLLASQSVSAPSTFGGLVVLDGFYDIIAPRTAPIGAGTSPGLMAITPTRNIAAAFDSVSNNVYAVDTTKQSGIGNVHLPGPTFSMVLPTADPVGYAAVPMASVAGFSFLGALEVMDFSAGGVTATIPVNNAQTVISSSSQSTTQTSTNVQLIVFSNDSNSIAVINPGNAIPPIDFSCYNSSNSSVCTIVPGFDRPVYGIINGSTAYILNCGPQCGGVQASVMVFDLPTLTITQTIPVDAATMAYLNGSTLYVAGTSPSPANNACTGETTAATTCGRLDIVDLTAGTVTGSIVITDGYHDNMDFTTNGQLFIGSRTCTNIGNINNPSGEVRGCLTIYRTADGSVYIPPDNGDVNALQGFTSRNIEYVAEGGALRVYQTLNDQLLINYFLPQGSINIVGYVRDVKAIDFF